MSALRSLLNSIVPGRLLAALDRRNTKKRWPDYADLTTKEIFTKIYAEGVWGRASQNAAGYYSGTGSHDAAVVETYVVAVRAFLSSLHRPNVVDLGCGDFSVGSQVRAACDRYVACDIVEPLIQFNRDKYRSLDVDFRVLNLAEDPLPPADVVLIRQVLQHLGNAQIAGAVAQIASKYRYLVLTEHLPAEKTFVPNLDHPSGPDNRLGIGSGIVLTKPPFNLRVFEERVLCEVPEVGGVIRTIMYRLSQHGMHDQRS